MIMTRERASNVATSGLFSKQTVVVDTGGRISFLIVSGAGETKRTVSVSKIFFFSFLRQKRNKREV